MATADQESPVALAGSSYVTVAGRGVLAFVGRDADRTVVWLRGSYDVSSVAALAELMARAIAIDESDLVVDLHQVQFMDAASVGVLVRTREFLGVRSRSLVLRSPSRIARSVLDVCGVTDLLEPSPVDATPMTAAGGALGTWVAVPATDRVDPRDDETPPEPSSTEEPARGGRFTVVPTVSSADPHDPADTRATKVAVRGGA